jgi:hypothetical protein
MTALLAAALKDLAAVGGAHSLEETVDFFSLNIGFISKRLFHRAFFFRL